MDKIGAETKLKNEITQWVKFSLGGENYGIRVLKVQEIQRYSEISPIPGAPSYVLGIIEITDDSRIVILEAGPQVIGILVDSVAEVISLKTSDVDLAPNVGNDETAKFIDGVSNKDGDLLILLDAEKILNEEEWEDLSHL